MSVKSRRNNVYHLGVLKQAVHFSKYQRFIGEPEGDEGKAKVKTAIYNF